MTKSQTASPLAVASLPDLIIRGADLPESARALAVVMAARTSRLFERDGTVVCLKPARAELSRLIDQLRVVIRSPRAVHATGHTASAQVVTTFKPE